MAKEGYSRKGFFGETIHYDANGRKIGESRPNLSGGFDHFDANGNKTGYSQRGLSGGMNHYDTQGNQTGYSQRGLFGETNHYDKYGHQTGESRRSFWGGSYYSGQDNAWERPEIRDEYEDIKDEMMAEGVDPDEAAEAAEWLEDHGYDPDDFDL